jgi:hypothetical protein
VRLCYQRSLRTNRLLRFFQRRAGYDLVQLPQFAAQEFRTIEKPTSSHLRHYLELTRFCGRMRTIGCKAISHVVMPLL